MKMNTLPNYLGSRMFFLLTPVWIGAASASEQACQDHLKRLGSAVQVYQVAHLDHKPAQLSELFTDSWVDDLSLFACPDSGAAIAAAQDIDARTDYTLEPLAAAQDLIVREKVSRHQPGQVLAVFADGSVRPVPLAGTPASLAGGLVVSKWLWAALAGVLAAVAWGFRSRMMPRRAGGPKEIGPPPRPADPPPSIPPKSTSASPGRLIIHGKEKVPTSTTSDKAVSPPPKPAPPPAPTPAPPAPDDSAAPSSRLKINMKKKT